MLVIKQTHNKLRSHLSFFLQAQKAKDREEDEHLMEKLDKDFESLAQSEALLSLMQPNKMNALKALLNKNDKIQTQKEGSFGSTIKEPLDKVCKFCNGIVAKL